MAREARYREICETLKTEILSGKYSSAVPFPSSLALARRFKATRFTIRQSLDRLMRSGLLRTVKGRGTFVTKVAVARKIGLLIPRQCSSELFQPIIDEIAHLAVEHKYELTFEKITAGDPVVRANDTIRIARDFVRQGVAGVIFQPNEGVPCAEDNNRLVLSILRDAGIEVVLCDYDIVEPPQESGLDVVGCNNIEAGMRISDHLIANGARRLMFFLPPYAAASQSDRYKGAKLSAAFVDDCQCEVSEARADDLNAVRRIMRGFRPDAFICCDDRTAESLVQTLSRLGVGVPADVYVAGFDDVRIASSMKPPLTTIHQPCEKIARAAFYRLLDRIADPCLDHIKIQLSAPMIVRESTCCDFGRKRKVSRMRMKERRK